ncbi:hypothetical protein BGZ95_006425 [Linnemannia exigua]|uniref:P-loop containing nucleoside triphosphate hydrolase protein n=1 Tax=Linnemannia exigua TaxID=604196 RepID=A0AAD4DMB3_9FUNG|nr:hypothetical protein BGZ95_006425 [Linnemannia exigua]
MIGSVDQLKAGFGFTPCFEYSILLGALSTLAIAVFIGRYVALRKWFGPHGLGRTAWIYWPTQICMSAAGVTSAVILVHLLLQDIGAVPAAVFGYSALAAAWLLAVPLNYYENIYSIRSSDVIFSFYILTITALSIKARTLYLLSDNPQDISFELGATLFIISVLIIGFIVEAWPRGSTKVQQSSSAPIFDKANLFSQATYFFYFPIIRLGNTKTLTAEDLENQLPECVYTANAQSRLYRYWKTEQDNARIKGKEPSLFRAIVRSQLIHVPGIFTIRFTRVMTGYAVPTFLSLLLAYFQDIQDLSPPHETGMRRSGTDDSSDRSTRNTSLEYGLLLVFAMFLAGFCNAILVTVSRQYSMIKGLEVRSALASMVYRKVLRLSPGSRQLSTTGQILNHVSVDADNWPEGGVVLAMWISIPLEIFFALYLLNKTLGWSAWIGLLTMMSMSPLQIWRVKVFNKLRQQMSELADERIRVMTEILSAIKVVKLYAWESPFLQRILFVRNRELEVMRRSGALDAAMSIVFTSPTLIISLVTLSVYATCGGPGFTPGTLTPQVVFVSMTLFSMLKNPISTLTETTSSTVRLVISTSRIQLFLLREEIDSGAVIRESSRPRGSGGEPAIVVQDATFSWFKESVSVKASRAENQDDADETQALLQEPQDSEVLQTQRPTLQHINLSVKSGSLVAIVGRVGQGKSSLLSALIGEMYKFHGYAKTIGRISYVPQQSWILNATLRDNILFGLEYDQERYDRIINASGLEPDLAILPAGDQTEIGERGINLSGGQKQRVALARAAYNDADIYLLDDPLSAVDAHVDQHLWSELIGPQGLLRNKTRLLVTHGIHHLQEVDQIILLKDGCIAETGHFEDLMAVGQTFCQLISEYAVAYRGQGGSSASSGAGSDNAETLSQETVESGASDDTAPAAVTPTRHEGAKDTKKDAKKDKKAGIIKVETSQDGGVKFSVVLTYLRVMSYKYVALIAICHVLTQLCYIGTTLWLKYWIGQSKADDQGHAPSLKFFLLVFSLLTLVYVLTGVALNWITFGLGLVRASEYLHRKFINRIMLLPPSFFDTTPLGRIINIASTDFSSIDERIPVKLNDIGLHSVSLIASLTVVALTTPLFLFASPLIALIYYLIKTYYLHASQAAKRIFRVSKSPFLQHFQESLAGVSTIRAMGLQTQFIATSATWDDKYSNAFIGIGYCIRWMEIHVQIVNILITLLASLWFILLPQGTVNAATAGLALSFAMSNAQSLVWFTKSYCEMYLHMVAVERVQEYSELETEAPLWTNPDSEAGRALDRQWPQVGRIEFVDYSTRYREGMDLVLKGISFTVEGGQKIGIVGRTGAGKSSLTLALFRMIEAANSEWAKSTCNTSNQGAEDQDEEDQVDGGKIVIDQVDISTLGLADLRKNLSIIPQEPVLFAGTVRENLDPFGELEDALLWEALERSYLKPVISALPGGLLFQVAQNGENFSVGQRSLICLARVLLRKTKILVLDEATSAVDIETDELIQKTIRTEFKDRTILTIAHRIKTVMDSDKILVLDHGRVVEFDAPKVLLQDENSLFYKLAKQAGES